ncbi:PRC-barrel domain protein [Aliiruegeria haliotis]|uniref:PRC-barrel domain protein n=1 Tax=Aliiruegeria haliotis TaxID=1280846 RepID=A0A2T0RUU6_9RHOB|nr:PRC-barrel domain-containing protein [Aliiruegeria haliotis]PRY24969.1 PRC-barrel domain protein [Aliiruegeria haliotis]
MRRLLTTTAVVLMTAMPVYAETQTGTTDGIDHSTGDMGKADTIGHVAADAGAAMADDPFTTSGSLTIHASHLIGQPVYIRGDAPSDADVPAALPEVPQTWDTVGEIGDVILSPDGEIDAITLDVGGFLGLGEKHIQASMENLEFVKESDGGDTFFVLYRGGRSALDLERDYDLSALELDGYSIWSAQRETVRMANESAAEVGGMAASDGMKAASNTPLTAAELKGMPVIGEGGDRVGEVSEIVISEGGEIEKVIVDVGGFLGLGEKSVALAFDDIEIADNMGTAGLAEHVVRIDSTEEELKSMETWQG